MNKKNTIKVKRMSEYAASQIPDGAVVDFIFFEDFNNDSTKEAVIGVTRFSPFPPDAAILVVKKGECGKMEHFWLPLQDEALKDEGGWVFDNAATADIDGEGAPELVVSRVWSHEHEIDIIVIDWAGDVAYPVWRSERTFFHGSMKLADIDGDGISEIIAECGTGEGSDVISLEESCYHVRESYAYKWNGSGFQSQPNCVSMPYISYNMAVDFLKTTWMAEYVRAYQMVVMPSFLGLSGLDDSSLSAFEAYIDKRIMPVLSRNLGKGRLIPTEPYDTCCRFLGNEDEITIEFVTQDDGVRISKVTFSRRKY